MKVFVAGATGVVGRRAVPRLIAAGHQVTAVARSAEKVAALREQGARAVDVILFEPAAVRDAVARHDVVINLATRIPPSSRMMLPGAWRANDRLRRNAARILADAALAGGATRFIQESVALAYADAGEDWIDEASSFRPTGHMRSVVDAEASARRFAEAGRAGVVLRFALFYGADSSHTLDTVQLVWKGIAPTFGGADGFVSSISTDDAAAAVVAALSVPAGTYNVADDEPLRRREYFASLAAALGVRAPRLLPSWFKLLGGSVGRAVARSQRVSNARFRRVSGWAPAWRSVREGWPVVLARLGGK